MMRQLLCSIPLMYVCFCQCLAENTQEKLSQLLNLLEIPHHQSIASIKQGFQAFHRKPGIERWQMQELVLSEPVKQTMKSTLKALGFSDTLLPDNQAFDYVFFLGGNIWRMNNRLNHILFLMGQGVKFNQLVVLSSQRPMDIVGDDVDFLKRKLAEFYHIPLDRISEPNTELEAAKMLLASEKAALGYLYQSCQFIDIPRVWHDGVWQRGGTRETVMAWLQTVPKPGRILVISNQPHAHYQSAVIKSSLPETFEVEVSADKMTDQYPMIEQLNAVALWLNTIND